MSGDEQAGDGSPEAERQAIAALVRDVAESGREIGDGELLRVRDYLATHTLRRPRQVLAGSDVLGYPHPHDGRPIQVGDVLDVAVAKYLKHVVRDEEWPPWTSVDDWLESLARVVRNEQGGVYIEREAGAWKLTFIARAPRWAGTRGGPSTVVVFNPQRDLWITRFRPTRGPRYVTRHVPFNGGRWLRRPI